MVLGGNLLRLLLHTEGMLLLQLLLGLLGGSVQESGLGPKSIFRRLHLMCAARTSFIKASLTLAGASGLLCSFLKRL